MQRSIAVPLLVVWLLCLADCASLLAASPDARIGLHRPELDLKGGTEEPAERGVEGSGHAGGLAEEVVSTWNEQVLEWDELTRCIRGSETGNAIERWLDCLESLEEVPALKPSETEEPQQLEAREETIASDAEVNGTLQLSGDNMGAFDPLSGASAKPEKTETSDGQSEAIEGLGSGREDFPTRMDQEISSDEGSGDQGFGTTTRIGHGDEIQPVAQSGTEMSETRETSSSQEISSEANSLPGKGDTRGATDARRSSSKWGTDISSVSGDSRSLPSR
jgi:hypothetical protein